MGLTYSLQTDIGSSIFGEAVREQILDHPVFSIYLRKCPGHKKECSEAGQLSLGMIDQNNCGPILDWVKIKENSTDWEFFIQGKNCINYVWSIFLGFSIGSKLKIKKTIRSITDTGSSHIYMPIHYARLIIALVQAKEDQEYGLIVPCNLDIEIKVVFFKFKRP